MKAIRDGSAGPVSGSVGPVGALGVAIDPEPPDGAAPRWDRDRPLEITASMTITGTAAPASRIGRIR
jgi:hypothetical protein